MFGSQRRILLDVLMACWGISTWLGVNGVYVQLPLLVQRLPEGWALPSSMTVAIQLANLGMISYVLAKKFFPRMPDAPFIYLLLTIGTLGLYLNSFLYSETAVIGGSERSVAFLAFTFIAGLVGCTSSVLFYPYLRHFRDVYLATYLVGEGLGGFTTSILSLIQGVGGEPECVWSPDNSTVEAIHPPPRFNTTVFMIIIGTLSAMSLVSFGLLHSLSIFDSERVNATDSAKDDEATNKAEEATTSEVSLLHPSWIIVLFMMWCLNALSNGVMPSVQSYSCMPYGTNAYHLAVTLGAMANPTACMAGVWLKPVQPRVLAAMLAFALLPFSYIVTTAALSPTPPLHTETGGEALIVITWVTVVAIFSYSRMWVYGFCRRGGGRGMRVCGLVTQLGSLSGSVTMFFIVNYANVFVQPPTCPPLSM